MIPPNLIEKPAQESKMVWPPFGVVDRDTRDKYQSEWLKFILELTAHSEPGKWDEKYGVMIFKANRGYQSAMKKIVDNYIKKAKVYDSDIIVMTETDDNMVKSWVIGNKDKIKQMVEDSLKSSDVTNS